MSATQIIPTLTILEDEGDFIVNVGAQANAASLAQALVPVIAKLGGARKLSLITPSGIKSFKFNGAGGLPESGWKAAKEVTPGRVERTVVSDAGAPPSAEDATAEFERFVAEEREAERVQREMDAATSANPDLPDPEAPPQPVKRAKAAKQQIEPAGSACGRCQGGGTLPGGGTCPVCRGKGVIAKWGGRRR